MPGHAQHVQVAIADLEHEQDVEPLQVTAQSTWKKSTAGMLVAWVHRNCRQLVSVCRTGAGGMRWCCRIRRIVAAPTRWRSVSRSPWILLDPAAMPALDRVRRDQAMPTQRSGQPPDEGGENRPVRPVQARTGVGAAQDCNLVPQHEELDVLDGRRSADQYDQSEHLQEDQIQELQRHVGIMPTRRSPLVSTPAPSSGTLQGTGDGQRRSGPS
jgi:hypothetical protein